MFGKRLSPNFRLSRNDQFQKQYPKTTIRAFSRTICSTCAYTKLKRIGFGSHGHVPKSENHSNEDLLGFFQSENEKLLGE